ncbi:hypothetical protein BCR32DRAFT_329168, partial [Anaeromyces robustus]
MEVILLGKSGVIRGVKEGTNSFLTFIDLLLVLIFGLLKVEELVVDNEDDLLD